MVLAVQAMPTPEEAIDVDAARAFAESFTGTLEAPAGIDVPDESIEARAPAAATLTASSGKDGFATECVLAGRL